MSESNTLGIVRRSGLWSAALAGLLGCCSCAAAQEPVSLDGRPRLAEMRKHGAKVSLTVVPVAMFDGPSKDVADALGLVLEKQAGMLEIHTTGAAFTPPAGADADKIPGLFGAWVKKNPVETDYALFAEFLGTPKTGATEVRATIVTKAGEEVWFDRQTPSSATFKRLRPREPMTCCVLVAERVKAALNLPRPGDKSAGEGRMERLWARKSGAPTKAERKAMDVRLETLRKNLGESKLLVYPAQVNGKPDPRTSKRIVAAALEAGFGKAEASDQQPSFELKPSSNEQKLLWDLARAFRQYARSAKPDADYTLFAQYMLSEKDQRVLAVHFVVCDRAGEWVIVDFQNSHHDDFNSVKPKSRDDCNTLLGKRLKRRCK